MFTLLINFYNFIKLYLFNNFPENKIGKLLIDSNKTIATTESCTGGLVSSMLTDVSGSSSYIFANFVTYSNEAKNKYLGVQEKTLLENGAVSPETAKEMAEGLIHTTNCDYAIATTGIAGPTGGSIKKPIGLMYIGLATKEKTKIIKVQKNPKLYRRLMKFAFAKEALNEFLIFMKEE